MIHVPDQKRRIGVRRLALGKLENMPAARGGFQPARLVMNFELYDEDQPEGNLAELEQPFELRVRYTRADRQRAESEGAALALAFWDGNTWVRFTAEKHGFHLEPDSNPARGGFGVVSITKWGDPPVSWGK
jgi:hypothetical protein